MGRLKFWRPKMAVPAVLVLAVIIVIFLLGKNLNRPAVGSQAVTKPSPPAAKTTKEEVRGRFINFAYPSDFSRHQAPTNTINLESYSLYKGPTPFTDIDIAVTSLPSGQLADNASYNFRRANPGRFTSSTKIIKGQSISIMDDKQTPYDKVAFWPHGEHLAIINLSGDPSKAAALDSLLGQLLAGLEWK